MTGQEALGYMLTDADVLAIRNKEQRVMVTRDDIESQNEIEARQFFFPRQFQGDSWEVGMKCAQCSGSGTIYFPCRRCGNRHLHSDPCCGGTDQSPCPDCDEGVKWEEEY